MLDVRSDLHSRVMSLGIAKLNLPENPESHFSQVGGKEKGRVRDRWDSGARFLSIKRRRKRDWNETLRLYDKVDYPEVKWEMNIRVAKAFGSSEASVVHWYMLIYVWMLLRLVNYFFYCLVTPKQPEIPISRCPPSRAVFEIRIVCPLFGSGLVSIWK